MAGRILLDVLVRQGVIGKEKLLYKTDAQTNLAEYYLSLDSFCRQSDKGTCLAGSIAKLLNIPLLSLSDFDDSLWRDSPSDCWERHLMIPHREHDGNIYLGMVNPFDAEALQQAEMVMGISLQRAVIDIHELASFFAGSVGTARLDYGQTVREVRQEYRLAGFVMPEQENTVDAIPAAIDSMISSMICKALEMSASDIHIDAMDNSAIIRFRIDKRLYLHTEIPADLKDSLTMSLLLRSGLDITCHAHPQEGSFQFNAENRVIDVRVAAMPTVQGQRLCLRLLDGVQKKLGLSEIGMGHAMAQSYRDTLLNKPGLIVVAGPTNSGKTTTMHAGLSEFDRDALSIFTLEDPVEYRLAGITKYKLMKSRVFPMQLHCGIC